MLFYKFFLKKKFVLVLFVIGCSLAIVGKGFGLFLMSISSSIPGTLGKLIYRYSVNTSYNISHGLTIGFLERFLVFILILYRYFSKSNKYNFYFILIGYGLLKMFQQYNSNIYQIWPEVLQ